MLNIRYVSKSFLGSHALKSVSMDLLDGEVHGLVGMNGAGKSTLAGILSGIYEPDEGKLILDGKEINLTSPLSAIKSAIYAVHQEPVLVSTLTVSENIFLGHLPSRHGFVNRAKMKRDACEVLRLLNSEIDADALVQSLSLNEKYIVSIVKAFFWESRILIMDEITAALDKYEKGVLFDFIRRLKSHGVSILYITHKIEELFEICDRYTVLRDGIVVGTERSETGALRKVKSMMAGKDIFQMYPPVLSNYGSVIMRVEDLTKKPFLNKISFSLHKGEILGISGLAGSGRSALIKTIMGVIRKDSGKIILDGKEVNFKSPSDAIDNGVGYLNENRITDGLFYNMDLMRNLTIVSLRMLNPNFFINLQKEKRIAIDRMIDFNINADSMNDNIAHLSGGNQQKVALARTLIMDTKVLLLDEPARGIDVVARCEIFLRIRELADEGKGIIIVSNDKEELRSVCANILYIEDGSIINSNN
jgi:ABC-type sugar transport system ATPase subunit